MKTLYLIQFILLSIVISQMDIVSSKAMPGSMMKVASNNMYGVHPMSRLVARGMWKRGLINNEEPDDYYEMEDNCPSGFIMFFRSGNCVPEKCGIGTTRDHATGECVEVDNNVPIIANYLDNPPPAMYGRPPFRSKSATGKYGGYKASKIFRGLAAVHGAA